MQISASMLPPRPITCKIELVSTWALSSDSGLRRECGHHAPVIKGVRQQVEKTPPSSEKERTCMVGPDGSNP